MVFRRQGRDAGGQFFRKRLQRRGRCERDFRFRRHRHKRLVRRRRPLAQHAHVAQRPRRNRHQIRAGEPILKRRRVRRQRAENLRTQHQCRGRPLHPPLDAPAPLPLFDALDQPGRLELAQVVVHLLPRQPQPPGQPHRRIRFLQHLQHPPPHRGQHGRDAIGVVEHVQPSFTRLQVAHSRTSVASVLAAVGRSIDPS